MRRTGHLDAGSANAQCSAARAECSSARQNLPVRKPARRVRSGDGASYAESRYSLGAATACNRIHNGRRRTPRAVNSAAPFRAPGALHVPRLYGGRSHVLQALVGRDVVSEFARVGVAICACVLSRVFGPMIRSRCMPAVSSTASTVHPRMTPSVQAVSPGMQRLFLKKRARVAELKRGTFMPVVRSTVGVDPWPAAYPDARRVALQPGSQRRSTLRLHYWCHR